MLKKLDCQSLEEKLRVFHLSQAMKSGNFAQALQKFREKKDDAPAMGMQ